MNTYHTNPPFILPKKKQTCHKNKSHTEVFILYGYKSET